MIQSVKLADGSSRLHIVGADKLLEDGYVPYLFRHSRKRNGGPKMYDHPMRKGWNLFGCDKALKMDGTLVKFLDADHQYWGAYSRAAEKGLTTYSPDVKVLVSDSNSGSSHHIRFGSSRIPLANLALEKHKGIYVNRMLRLPYAIAFAKPGLKSTAEVAGNMVTPLMQFSTIYNPDTEQWCFGK